MDRRCQFCGEVYGEKDCARCGRGMCETCDVTEAFSGRARKICWDCRNDDGEAG